MSEEIIAYRIGESLFCPDCYEKSTKRLKAVQNPEDLQVTFPSKPIKAEDIRVFICNDCKTIKGNDILTGEKIEIPERKDLNDLLDMIDDSVEKIAFLEDFFSHTTDERALYSEDGRLGLYHILVDLQRDLGFVSNQISEKYKEGLIVEETE